MIPLLLWLAAHTASEGKSRFDIEPDGAVAVEIELGALDLPELCNVDLSVTSRRAEQEARLDTCVHKGLPLWLRIAADGATCPLTPEGWRERAPATVPPVLALSARAACTPPIHHLTIDWGLFRGTPLDHTSVARIRVPHEEDRLFLFSRRASRLELELKRPLLSATVAVVVAAVLALAGGALIWRWRRRG